MSSSKLHPSQVRRASWKALTAAGTVSIGLALSACTVAPTKPVEAAPIKITLQDYLQDAARARADGNRDKARDTYRVAAKAFPTSKEPWVKLSEDYFEGADYGNAILSAQEVLARDGADTVGASVLAISGLRVSGSALQVLRSQTPIADSTRTEAQSMARTLHDVLADAAPVAPAPPVTAAKPKRRAAPPAVKPIDPTAVVKQADATPPTSGNTFNKLK